MWLKHMTSALSALFGGGPELTPEQEARLERMESDYQQLFGRPSKPAKAAPKNR